MRKLPALIARSHLTIKKRLALTLSPRPQQFPQHLSSADCVRAFPGRSADPAPSNSERACQRLHFAEEQTEAQRGKVTCPRHTGWAWRSRDWQTGCWRHPTVWALRLALVSAWSTAHLVSPAKSSCFKAQVGTSQPPWQQPLRIPRASSFPVSCFIPQVLMGCFLCAMRSAGL